MFNRQFAHSGLELKSKLIHIKEAIWTIMTIIFITVYIKRNKAQKAFIRQDFITAKKYLQPIANIYIPLNIILGLLAIYLGVTLRGF